MTATLCWAGRWTGTASCRARNGTCREISGKRQAAIVLPDYQLPPADLYAYYPSRQQQPAKIRAFIDFLAQHFAA
jgi:DNA-binding transcriptional LysR family regulator